MKRSIVAFASAISMVAAACAAPAAPAPTAAPAAAPTTAGAAAPKPTTAPAAAAPTTAAAAPAAPAKDLGKVRVSTAGNTIGQFMLEMAIRGGFFKEEGLEVEHVPMGSQPEATAAALAGSVEFSAGEGPQLLKLIEVDKQPIKGIVVAAIGDGLFLAISKQWGDSHGLTAQSTVDQKLSSLQGAKVAISSPGSSGTVRTEAVIKARGVTDLTLIPTGGGAPQLAAMEAGQVDAFAWTPPFPQQAAKNLGALLVNYEEVPELQGQIGSIHFTSEKIIAEKPEVVQAYVNGMGKSLKYLRSNKAAALEVARETFPNLDANTLELSFDAYYGFLTKGILPTEEGWANTIDVYNLVNTEKLPEAPVSTVFDLTFVNKTVQQLDIK